MSFGHSFGFWFARRLADLAFDVCLGLVLLAVLFILFKAVTRKKGPFSPGDRRRRR